MDSDAFNAVNGDIPVAVLEILVIELKAARAGRSDPVEYALRRPAHMSETAFRSVLAVTVSDYGSSRQSGGRRFNRLDESVLVIPSWLQLQRSLDTSLIRLRSSSQVTYLVLADRENGAGDDTDHVRIEER